MAFKEQCAACPEIASHKVLLSLWDDGAVVVGDETLNEKTTITEAKVCNDCLHTLEIGMEPLKVDGVEYGMWGYRGKL